jgi:hypothetical protein
MTRKLRKRVAAEQNGLCYYCQKPMLEARLQLPLSETLEHIPPRPMRKPGQKAQIYAAAHKRCNARAAEALARFLAYLNS